MKTAFPMFLALTASLMLPSPVDAQRKELIQLQADVVRLSQQVSQLQTSSDERNSVLRTLVEKMADQMNTLTDNFQRIERTVGAIQTQGDKSSSETRTALTTLSRSVSENLDQFNQALEAVRGQLGSLSQQVSAMKTTAEPLATPESLLRMGTADFLAGNYELAISGFRDFLQKFPADPRAADAQLYVADGYYNQKKYEQAVVEYDLLLQKFPNGDKTGSALYKKGLALVELKQPQTALAIFRRVVMDYPNTSEASGAQIRIRELSAPAPRRR